MYIYIYIYIYMYIYIYIWKFISVTFLFPLTNDELTESRYFAR